MSRPLLALVLFGTGAVGAIAACTESSPEPAPPTMASEPTEPDPEPEPEPQAVDAPDAGAMAEAPDAAEPPPYEGPFLGALFTQTPIMSEMEWPKKDGERRAGEDEGSVRIGYIRRGEKVPVLPEPHVKSNCSDGWYELVQGGFVCGRYASLDLNHPKIKLAPHPPDMVGPLPYQYGYNAANGTPLYRTVPSREARMKLEPWLAPKPKKKPVEVEVDETTASYGEESLDAGVPSTLVRTAAFTATTTDPFGLGADELDAGTPWYLRTYDGGKPTVTLDELRGDGPIDRRMVKGFFVGLDEEMKANGWRWWKTTKGQIAPFERIIVHKTWSKFHGIWLDDTMEEARIAAAAAAAAGVEEESSPDVERKPTPGIAEFGSPSQVAFIMRFKAKKYEMRPSRKAVVTREPISRRTAVRLTGDTVTINGAVYEESDEGFWIRASDARKTSTSAPPPDLGPNEKWIDVNVKNETLVAFEGTRAVFATLVSSGKEDRVNKEKDHRTPTGSFRVREKHIAATMDGDVASDGPYSIEDVPWILYYSGSYAIHGAFWHNSFGTKRSHGCTNLAPIDARALFNWTEPSVPEGWHAVWSTADKPGTRVVVHE